MTSSESFFVIFAAFQGAPRWLWKTQDISVSFTNLWCLVSAGGGKTQKTKGPPPPLDGFQAWAGARGHDALPVAQRRLSSACGASAPPAAPRSRRSCWLWRSPTRGKQPNKLDATFSGAPAVRSLLLPILKIRPVDAVPARGHLPAGSCRGGRPGGEPEPAGGIEYLQAASPLFPCPRIISQVLQASKTDV